LFNYLVLSGFYIKKQKVQWISENLIVALHNGGTRILISTESLGTYSFDTAGGEWSKLGDWALPFWGRAEYVREYDLSFGFSAADHGELCASDLGAVQKRPPVARYAWERASPFPVGQESWSRTSFTWAPTDSVPSTGSSRNAQIHAQTWAAAAAVVRLVVPEGL
jgi:hypothetical protein